MIETIIEYDRITNIEPIRKTSTGTINGVGFDVNHWFVYVKLKEDKLFSKHCGPYSTKEQAIDWIMSIRDTGKNNGTY